VLDVKVGNGAIFDDTATAEKLAEHLIRIAAAFNLNTVALLTDMSQPLGVAVGNWLEVCEAIEILKGGGPEDTKQVTLALGAIMLQLAPLIEQSTGLAGKDKDLRSGMARLRALLENGAAWQKFLEIVRAQDGDARFLENPDQYPAPKNRMDVKAGEAGFVAAINAREIGRLCMLLGAGRKTVDDAIDYTAGMLIHKKIGDSVHPGEPLITLQNSGQAPDNEFQQMVHACFSIRSQPASPPKLLQKLFDTRGIHFITEID
jgi:thymidine phosphorylase